MRQISLDELPQWTMWPERLLGLKPWEIPTRDAHKIAAEYNGDKYARLLEYLLQRPDISPNALRRYELVSVVGYGEERCISFGNELLVTGLDYAWGAMSGILVETVGRYSSDCRTVVELGCGWGYNLWLLQQVFPNKRYIGGEFSENARQVAKAVLPTSGPRVYAYDMLTPGCSLPGDLEPPVLVLTVQAVEQLPSCKILIGTLLEYGSDIGAVLHLEPNYLGYNKAFLLGLMRTWYTETNDYNRDLQDQICRDEIYQWPIFQDVFGYNPLNPISVLAWRPR